MPLNQSWIEGVLQKVPFVSPGRDGFVCKPYCVLEKATEKTGVRVTSVNLFTHFPFHCSVYKEVLSNFGGMLEWGAVVSA